MAKEKKKKEKKSGFWKEFKEFISRGNVLDMAVGIIIGGAFTAIVTALCDNVLKPIINWLLALIIGSDSLDGILTFLKKATDEAGAVDLANSIYIDWGALINAIINFLLIALVLFLIIKAINSVHKAAKKAKEEAQAKLREKEKAEETAEAAEEASAEAAAEEAAPAEPVAAVVPVVEEAPAPTTEELLAEIRDLLKAQPEQKKAATKKPAAKKAQPKKPKAEA